jgi:hypothetical protein
VVQKYPKALGNPRKCQSVIIPDVKLENNQRNISGAEDDQAGHYDLHNPRRETFERVIDPAFYA